SDLVWIVDGYDACNRMERLATASTDNQTRYVDVIKLLREDGSLLELVNVQPHTSTSMERRPELYTGYYRVNEANAHGYAIVEYDSTYWPNHIRSYAQHLTRYNYPRYPFIPRRLRYFSGDGLEYLFREWIAPNGLQVYSDSSSRFGGMWAGPTVFYLENISSNNVVLTRALRSRHYSNYIDDDITPDSTKGRALFTELENVCEVLYGKRSIAVQAGGRTVQAVFDTVALSGRARDSEYMPLAQLGYLNAWSKALTSVAESRLAYKSFVGYITKIIDPEGRPTRFTYEKYKRRMRGFGFPVAGTGVEVGLQNWRMVEIDEPTSRYEICYYRGDVRNQSTADTCGSQIPDELLTYNTMSANNPSALNNIVRSVRKYEHDNTLLITDSYSLGDFSEASSSFATAVHNSIDHPGKTRRTLTYRYVRHELPELEPFSPAPIFTELRSVLDDADGHRTLTTTHHSTPTSSSYLWMPASTVVSVNGVRKSLQRLTYEADTVRRYGNDAILTAAYGWEITRALTHTFNPDSTLRTVDTVDYRHFALRDSITTTISEQWLKIPSLQRYMALLATPGDTVVAGRKWEEMLYAPGVAVYRPDTVVGLITRTPHYGLEMRRVTTDADGDVLTGRCVTFRGDSMAVDDPSSPALVAEEFQIGRAGARLRIAQHRFGRDWTRNRAVLTTNANGARVLTAFDSLRDGSDNAQSLLRVGTRLTDDDSTRRYSMRGLSPELLEEPLAEARIVRRATANGSIEYDTLMSESERSYFGSASAGRDPNGWLTQSTFDRNGRLLATWLPGDYPRASPPDTFYYTGADSIDLYGTTSFTRRIDFLRCRVTLTQPKTYPRDTVIGTYAHITNDPSILYAGRPVLVRPRCPCGDTATAASAKGAASLMRDCRDSVTYPMLGEYPGYRGHLFHRVDRHSALLSLDRLDSAMLRLYVSNIEGECVSVQVSIAAFNFTMSYLFNCSIDRLSDNPMAGNERPRLFNTSVRSARTVPGPYLDVRLDSVLERISSLAYNDTFGVDITVTSPGTGIRFASGSDAADMRPKLLMYGRYRTLSDTVDYTLAYRHVDDSLMTEVTAKSDDLAHTSNRWTVNRYHGDIRRSRIRHFFGADYRHRHSQISIGEPTAPSRLDTVSFAYNGVGARTAERDQIGSGIVKTIDGRGRVTAIVHQDGSATAT
ncbi:MAG: hypothetical protein H7X80_08135, partial [bacterium]|nr:hypothetical protein [Candidatus Kapabacteria bacterium]